MGNYTIRFGGHAVFCDGREAVAEVVRGLRAQGYTTHHGGPQYLVSSFGDFDAEWVNEINSRDVDGSYAETRSLMQTLPKEFVDHICQLASPNW